MFEISFSELLVIAVVALIVIGPEKLPKVARTAGAFFGRMQRMVAQVKDEVNREARFAELQKLQGEVASSLQQEFDAVSQTILPPPVVVDAALAPEARLPAKVKSARKPRKKVTQVVVEAESVTVKPQRKPRRNPENTRPAVITAHGDTVASSAPLTAESPKPRARRAKPKTTLPAEPDKNSA